jgi:hypothetical protein
VHLEPRLAAGGRHHDAITHLVSRRSDVVSGGASIGAKSGGGAHGPATKGGTQEAVRQASRAGAGSYLRESLCGQREEDIGHLRGRSERVHLSTVARDAEM